MGYRFLHVSSNGMMMMMMTRVKCLHLLRRWESKLVLLREPRLQYHSTKETRPLSFQFSSIQRPNFSLPFKEQHNNIFIAYQYDPI